MGSGASSSRPEAEAGGPTIRAGTDEAGARDELRARLLPPALDPALLGDIDAWGLRQEAGWLRFTARLEASGPREYQRPLAGGDIIASAPGPLLALLSLGGPRRAGFNEGPPAFAWHVLAPGDDIGAVGAEGVALTRPTPRLQRLRHASRDALLADVLLGWRRAAFRALPLILTRAETDTSADVTALGEGLGFANFCRALDSLVAAAESLGRQAQVIAVGLDYALEDCRSDALAYAAGMRALMARIETEMAARGLAPPQFLAPFDCGTAWITDHPAILGQWHLALAPGSHRLAFSAPGYMFEQDRFGRPTEAARLRMAEMDAHALVGLSAGEGWHCPLFLLAESAGAQIRVTARAMADLVIEDAFGTGPGCGFRLTGTAEPRQVVSVALAPDDPQALILTCDGPVTGPVTGPAPLLLHAFAAPPAAPPPCSEPRAANRSAIRDRWQAPGQGGAPLHRWALPAVLPVHQAGAQDRPRHGL